MRSGLEILKTENSQENRNIFPFLYESFNLKSLLEVVNCFALFDSCLEMQIDWKGVVSIPLLWPGRCNVLSCQPGKTCPWLVSIGLAGVARCGRAASPDSPVLDTSHCTVQVTFTNTQSNTDIGPGTTCRLRTRASQRIRLRTSRRSSSCSTPRGMDWSRWELLRSYR